MRDLVSQIQLAFRSLLKTPLFFGVAVVSLALGIGANTAIFTLVDQLMLRLLPVKDPRQLVQLDIEGGRFGNNRGQMMFSHPLYLDLRDKNAVFDGVFARRTGAAAMREDGAAEQTSVELVSGNYFDVLGVRPERGRLISPADDVKKMAHPVAVITHSFWQNRFGGDPNIVGRKIQINGHPFTIVGVTQAGFAGLDAARAGALYVPIMMKSAVTPTWDELDDRRSSWLQVFARLKPGVSQEQALASLKVLYKQIQQEELKEKFFAQAPEEVREKFRRQEFRVAPAQRGYSGVRNEAGTAMWVLMGVVGLVLLIACANVAGLMIARGAARTKEIAVRLSLGANRRQILGQMFTESILLSLIAGALGLAIGSWTSSLLIRWASTEASTMALSATPDWRILAFTMGVSILTGLIFGAAPALQATRVDVFTSLKDQTAAVLGGHGQVRLRRGLVVTQVALSLLLLIGAGLFLRSLTNLRSVDPGFQTSNLIAFVVNPANGGYGPEKRLPFFENVLERLRSAPGVQSATVSSINLLGGDDWSSSTTVDGYQAKPGEDVSPFYNAVGPNFFETLGIKLDQGRTITQADLEAKRKVALVNRKFASRYIRDRNPLGVRIAQGTGPNVKPDVEIIGIVSDTKYNNLGDEHANQVFMPYYEYAKWLGGMVFYVRTNAAPEQMFNTIRSVVREIDPNLPVMNMKTVEQVIDESMITQRLIATLCSVFSFLATGLAALGLYGLLAFVVARRTREIGVRVALGATRSRVSWLVMKEVVVLLGIGLAIGLAGSLWVTNLVQKQLYKLQPNDPLTISLAIAVLAAVALLAGYMPARKASRVDPMRALRYE